MYNPNGGFPMRNRGMFGASGYRYETLPYGQEGVQEGSLISKVMGLLATSFLFAFIGTLIGMFVIPLTYGGGPRTVVLSWPKHFFLQRSHRWHLQSMPG